MKEKIVEILMKHSFSFTYNRGQISVHEIHISNDTLRELLDAGVKYISTPSIRDSPNYFMLHFDEK
jgi:hypothetical protein